MGQEHGIYLFLFLTYIFTRYLQNIHEKIFWTHEIPTKKTFDPQNTYEKKIWSTKFPREKILDSRNTHEKKFRTLEDTVARWPTRPTMARAPRNLAHSIIYMIWLVRITYTYKYTCILKKHIQTLHRYTAPYIVKHTETLPRLQKLHDHLQQHEVRDKYLLNVFRYHVQLEKCDLNYISTNFYKTR